ncbi:glycoside hydrolase family 20 zincin-like fold domain-containing protein, partial [Phytoactinopolyspora endophytica]|uniref:glycoside hydrolase family 20 zincin-like fold domain-containing protein n=1 Tax=Phytoactinopolyspora endophytica TaxID=1642495 RepID=UPI0013ED2FF8
MSRRARLFPVVTATTTALLTAALPLSATADPATTPTAPAGVTSTNDEAAPPSREGNVVLGPEWMVLHGPDIVEKTAAEHLAEELGDRLGIDTALEVRAADRTTTSAALKREDIAGVIVVGTPDDNRLLAIADRRDAFDLPGDSPEAYHLRATSEGAMDVVLVAGATPKGAMNGAFRLEQRLERENSLDVAAIDEADAPAFANRVGGHKFTQSPPPGWTDDQQGEYYAQNYMNVVWGEKHGAPLPADVREKWGLRLAYEVPLPGVGKEWLNDPEHADSICVRGNGNRTVDPFTAEGAAAYADVFAAALNDPQHDDLAILETVFGDYSHIPTPNSTRLSDDKPCGLNKADVAVEIMTIMQDVIGDRDVTPMAWMWHLYPAETDADVMERLRDLGVGILYNEAGNGDNWITRRTNFNGTALETENGRTKWGPDYASLVSAGGSCESVKPVIGLPTPHAAATKLRELYDIEVQNFYLWWGGVEGWTYSSNMSVIREMVWEPDLFDPTDTTPFDADHPDPLMARVATTDFGADKAADVMRYWSLVDKALLDPSYRTGEESGLRVYSWYQRLAIYLNPGVYGGGAALRPLTPDGLKSKEFNVYRNWPRPMPEVIANFDQVATDLAQAN